MDDAHKLDAVLRRHFPPEGLRAPDYYIDLLTDYLASGLAAPGFVRQLEVGDPHALWSSVWEAMLYRHLVTCGHTPRNNSTKNAQNGPDFLIEVGGKSIWIEAVVPKPEGIPAEYLEWPPRDDVGAVQVPDVERVLRCTQVIRDKREKFATYREAGIVGEHDCTIIAVNICSLSRHDIRGTGRSRGPLCMEALYGIGPIGYLVSPEGKIAGPWENTPRHEVAKPNGASVETTYFLDPLFSNVSAVVQAHERWIRDDGLKLATMHNPLADNRLPQRLFNARAEWVGTDVGDDEFDLVDIAWKPPT